MLRCKKWFPSSVNRNVRDAPKNSPFSFEKEKKKKKKKSAKVFFSRQDNAFFLFISAQRYPVGIFEFMANLRRFLIFLFQINDVWIIVVILVF